MVGRFAGVDMDIDVVNGGSGFRSNGGGGGRPSDALGEFELFRTRELREGENIGRWGKRGLIAPCAQG
jgi:hypothetical protein